MAVLKEPFGRTRNGEDVDKYILRSGELEAEVLTFGATIRRLLAPARSGEPVDVVLGYDSVRGYEDNGGYLGALVGRYANRIAGPCCVVDGETVPLEANEGASKQLHGGSAGFSHRERRHLLPDEPGGGGGLPGDAGAARHLRAVPRRAEAPL